MEKIVAEYLSYLYGMKGLADSTIRKYKLTLEGFLIYLERKAITSFSEVTYKVAKGYVYHLYEAKCTKSRLYVETSNLRCFFKHLCAMEHVAENPFLTIKIRLAKLRLPKFHYYQDLIKVFENFKGESSEHYRDYMIMEILYATGIRGTELAELTLANVNLSEGLVKVLGKRKKERIVPIGIPAITSINKYLEHSRGRYMEGREPHDYLIVNNDGSPVTIKFIRKRLVCSIYQNKTTSILQLALMNLDTRSPHTY